MAFNNWGSWVFKNGERRKDRECVEPFSTRLAEWESTWSRVWAQLMLDDPIESSDKVIEEEPEYFVRPDEIEMDEIEFDLEDEFHPENMIHHAVLGDENIRLVIYKDSLDLLIKTDDKVTSIELVSVLADRYEGIVHVDALPDCRIVVKKYRKRQIGLDCIRWRWLWHPGHLFLWIDPCSRWSWLRQLCWRRLCWNHIPRMEVWFRQKDTDNGNDDLWYTYSGLSTGSTFKGDKFGKMKKRWSVPY